MRQDLPLLGKGERVSLSARLFQPTHLMRTHWFSAILHMLSKTSLAMA